MSRGNDVELVRRAQRGDRRALDLLVRREMPIVYSAVARMLPGGEVDDVVQETLVNAIRHLDALREPSRLRPWLLTIAVREARRHAQALVAGPVAVDTSVPEAVDAQERAVARLTLSEQRRELAEATAWLDADDREMLALWWLELLGEVDRAGLVDAAGGTPNHVAVRVKRVRERLQTVRMLVRALDTHRRTGACADLGLLMNTWPGTASSVWRKRLAHHVVGCHTCGGASRDMVAPERLLAATPLLAVPVAAAQPAVLPAAKGVLGATRRLLNLGKAAVTQPAVAVVTTAAVLSGGGMVAYANRSAPARQEPAQAAAPSAAPVPGLAATPASPTPSVRPSARPSASAAVSYRGPLTITKGGTYRGNWRSTDPRVPAVSVRTSEPVVIEGCQVRGPGDLISARFSDRDAQTDINLTVRNCRGYGEDPRVSGKARGFFLLAVWPRNVVVENNYVEHTRGVNLVGNGKPGVVDGIRVLRNQVRNVDGRITGAKGCRKDLNVHPFTGSNGQCGSNAVLINGFHRTRGGVDIGWNEIINTAGQSNSEDNIIVYNSSGTPERPIRVHDNYVQGAYPANPATDPSSGSGINIADSDRTGNPATVPAWVRGENNQIVSATNVGIFIAAGHDNTLVGNRVVSSGRLPNGRTMNHFFTGIYVWDCCYQHVAKGIWKNNTAIGNTVGYVGHHNGGAHRYDYKLDDCTAGRCTGNTSLPGTITPTTEKAEYQRWITKTRTTHTTIGPR